MKYERPGSRITGLGVAGHITIIAGKVMPEWKKAVREGHSEIVT